MFIISKRMEVAGSHSLSLDYQSKCSNLHGHNWIITVWCRSEELDQNGMVIDFGHIKEKVHGQLDHKHINYVSGEGKNPTAEYMAQWICDQVGPKCFKVEVQESEGNIAIYERD